MENTYSFKAIKDISIRDEDLAKMFLIKKTPAEVKACDAAIAKLPPKERTRLMDPEITSDSILSEMQDVVDKDRKAYSNLLSLPSVDLGFIVQNLYDYYRLIARNPRLYKINYTAFMNYYEALLAENWEVFDRERIALEKNALATNVKRRKTTKCNTEIFNKLANLIASIDLQKVSSYNSSYEL